MDRTSLRSLSRLLGWARRRKLLRHPMLRPVRQMRSVRWRSEEHTFELQSLMRILYAVFFLEKVHRTDQKYNRDININIEAKKSITHAITITIHRLDTQR